jgi:hypothetical protein
MDLKFGFFWNDCCKSYRVAGWLVKKKTINDQVMYMDQKNIHWDNFEFDKSAKDQIAECNNYY